MAMCSASGPCAIGQRRPAWLEDRQHQFLGRSRIGRGLQHDELAALQVRLDGARGLLHIGEIGFAALIERRGHADHHRIHLRQAREVVGGGEMLGADVLLNFCCRDMADVALALVEFGNFCWDRCRSR